MEHKDRTAGSQTYARLWDPQRPPLSLLSLYFCFILHSVSRLFLGQLHNLGVRGPSRFFLWISILGQKDSDQPSLVWYHPWTKHLVVAWLVRTYQGVGGPSLSFTIS